MKSWLLRLGKLIDLVTIIMLIHIGFSIIGSTLKHATQSCGKTYHIDRYIYTNLFCESGGK